MKLELTIEKNVVLKRDKPWSNFYFINDEELLCYNEHRKFESVNSSNGKIDHVSNKTIGNISKSSLAHCLSNNGRFCGFLSPNYEITIWDKDKLIRMIPSCLHAIKAIKTKPYISISNNGEQLLLIFQHPYRIFLWIKSSNIVLPSVQHHHHKSPICSSVSNRSTHELGTWHELNITNEQFNLMNDDKYEISIDSFYRSKNASVICAFVFYDASGYIQINRLDIEWKSSMMSEKSILYTFETLRIPMVIAKSLCFIRFAHTSPILAVSFLTNILFISLTTLTFSKLIPITCSFKTSPSHQHIFINDFIWSYDDQFVIGLTNRGGLFFLNRFGSQFNLVTQGECITQGPSLFVIIHPLIGKDSEATTHLGLDSFMQSIAPFSDDDKTKQQKFSLAVNTNKSLIYCSDGYRLARLTYSNKIRDRRFYDPLLNLYLLDINKQQEQSIFSHKTRSFDEFPKVLDRTDTDSIGDGGEMNLSKKYGSLTSLTNDDLPELSLEDVFSAYHLLLTSSERVQHEICSCLQRTTRTLLTSSTKDDILTSVQLSHSLTNLVLSSSFGSLNFIHLSCLTKFLPLFIEIFEHQTSIVNDPELLQLCILYIVEQWLQAILYIPTTIHTFELCRRQKIVKYNEDNEGNSFQLCKAVKQLQLLQGANINLDDFLPTRLPDGRGDTQVVDLHYNRFTLLRSWYSLWLSIEKKFRHDIKNLPKYLTTIRLFIQSILYSYPSLNAIRLLSYGRQIDLNDLFPPVIASVDHPLHTKGYSTLNERRKQRRRSRNSIDMPNSARPFRRGKPPTEARKALILHRILYALFEQYNIRDAVCILNVALRRETSSLSSCVPIDLFSANLFQNIDTRTYFGMPGHALRSVLRTLARFMARSMMTKNNTDEQQLFIYSIDSACPLPNLFKTKQKLNERLKYRMIYIDHNRLNLAIQQQKMSKFWQPLKVLELFILGQSPNEAVLFAKLVGDWRTALCLASVLPTHNNSYDGSKTIKRLIPSYTPLNAVTVDALLYTKLCEYLQIDNLKSVLKRSYKQDEIMSFIQNLPSTLEQFLLCATLLQVPLTEMLLRRLNAIMIYLYTSIPIFISSKYYLPCPPIYSSILNTYDEDKHDITCKYEIHVRLIYYRTIHIFIQLLSATRIQLSCLKWYLDYLTMTNNKRKKTSMNETDDSFYSIKVLLKSLRFHKLPNIPDRILIYFRDFCIILFLLDTRDRLSLTLRSYIRNKLERTNLSDKLSWKIISYATILLSFRCLISDEMELLRVVLNLFFDLPPSEQLMRALATLMIARQHHDNDLADHAEVKFIVDKLQAKWARINPTFIQLYEGFLESIILQDVQGDIIQHYMNETQDYTQTEPLFDFKPKWFETSVEYGEFMTMLIPLLLDTSSLTNAKQKELNNDHTKYDTASIPLLHTMSAQLRELELPISLDKRYLLKQTPLFVPPNEYVVFPVRMVPYDTQQTMFQQAPASVNNTTIGTFVSISTTQQPPGVVTLENHHRRSHLSSNDNTNQNNMNPHGNSSIEWDGRSDDPSRSHVRQFDEPYSEAARRSIWMSGWSNRGFSTTTDQTQTPGMRIPVSAQFLAASSLVSDPRHFEAINKRRTLQNKNSNDQAENDTDFTNITKDSEDEEGGRTQSDLPLSPRRRDASHRKNSLEESVSLPMMSTDGGGGGGGEFGRSCDMRAPSRETGGDETPTYDIRDFPTDYYKAPATHQPKYQPRASPTSHVSPSTMKDFRHQQSPHSVRQSMSDRRFLDDSDPYAALRLEQEEREKYSMNDTNRTMTSKESPLGHYPSSRESNNHQLPYQDATSRRSPTRDPLGHRSPTRNPNSQRSSSREKRDRQNQNQNPQHQQQYFPQIPVAPSIYNQASTPASVHFAPSLRLPLLRLGAPSIMNIPTVVTQARFQLPVAPVNVYPPQTGYIPVTAPRPLAMLHLAPQLPPPASLSPRATRNDEQKYAYVQNIMQNYADSNRPRLQLLHMRPHPRTMENNDLTIPMPVTNVVAKSSETKVDAGIQAEVPRQDGFVIEPGLFQKLLHDATGVNFTSAEAHYAAAREIQKQALDAQRRERSTMTDLPAHQILYDLQYARGGEGDERKFVNVTDITGPHADALMAQIQRDQIEREQILLRQQQSQQQQQQQQQQQVSAPPMPPFNNMYEQPSTSYPIGFERQHAQIFQQQQYQDPMTRPSYPLGYEQQNGQISQQPSTFYNPDELQQRSESILQRRRQREQEEQEAERIAFGNIETDRSQRRVTYEPNVQTYEIDEPDVPYEYLIRQKGHTESVPGGNSQLVDPISVRSNTPRSPHTQLPSDRQIPTKTTTPRDPFSARRQSPKEHPISIKTTTPRDPFSPRRTASQTSYSTAGTPRKTSSPTIADRHREARQRKQQQVSRELDRNALRFADAVLHGEHVPETRTLDEFQLEALETSYTSTVRDLAGPDGLINRTYDLDLREDDDDDINYNYSERIPSRPMSATTSNNNNNNRNTTQYSTSSAGLPRPSSASSTRSSRQMTPMGKAIIQSKKKGPPPARSNMARKRPLSSPGNLGQKRGSMTVPVKSSQIQTKIVRTIRKASPPAHKPMTYNERVRALNKTDSEIRSTSKADPTDPKSLMRLYGTRRVPGLYVPYEKTDPRVTKTYSERMKELQQPTSVQRQPRESRQQQRRVEDEGDEELEQRPSSAPSSSQSLSDWEVDDRVKQLLFDDQDATFNKKFPRAITPLANLDELDDEDMDDTTYSLTRVTEQTNENTYGDDLRLLQFRRPNTFNTNTYSGTKMSARSSAGGDMTARDESELSVGESSIPSCLDWSALDREFPTGTH